MIYQQTADVGLANRIETGLYEFKNSIIIVLKNWKQDHFMIEMELKSL